MSGTRNIQIGFTLIEVMVVVVIISILTAIALPSYQDYVRQSKISDATSTLSTKRIQLEKWFQDTRSYLGAPACNADSASSRYFDFSCPTLTTAQFELRATGKDSMAGFQYSITQQDAKSSVITASGWTGNGSCWATRKGGSC